MTVRVVCTAGHVDHGKSTLVRALTGMEPDRFAEERRRGLTIDLGFAWTDIEGPEGRITVSFVDLPGHERFIANMLAGAGPVELALFVVAADEGWKPQSQEHLDILDLLGVERGLVAITKADLADAQRLEHVTKEVRERLAPSTFRSVDAVPVSAATGAGLDELRRRLAQAMAAAPQPIDEGRPRVWVDRSFSIRGAGTVVTGTLGGGRLRAGDEISVEPGGRRARIRGVQSLQASVDEAAPGTRVALNLAGIERSDVRRGQVVVLPGQAHAVDTADLWVRTVTGGRVGRRGAWHLHAGSGEWLIRITPLSGDNISRDGFVRVTLAAPAPLVVGDRFVLRDAGRKATIAGGLVLDTLPPPLRRGGQPERVSQLQRRLDAVRAGDRALLLSLHVVERGADDRARAAAAVGLGDDQLDDAVQRARLLPLGPSLAAPSSAAAWTADVRAALASHHAQHPVDRTAPKAVAVRAAIAGGCPPELAETLIDVLSKVGRVVGEGGGVRHPDHRVQLDERHAAARQRLLERLSADPFSPPSLSGAARAAGAETSLVREMEAAGEVVRLSGDVAMTADAVQTAIRRLRDAYSAEGPLTAARAKEVLGTTRKYALPLLEYLDSQKVTRRRGDVRDVLG